MLYLRMARKRTDIAAQRPKWSIAASRAHPACRHLYNQVVLPRMKAWLLEHVQARPTAAPKGGPGGGARLPLQALTANLVNTRAGPPAMRIGMRMR